MSLILDFFIALKDYVIEIAPALAIGFFLSGLIHEFLPAEWVEKNLGGKGIRGILYATLVGAIMPVCCWGSLPIAITFHKRGASLGPVLAVLVATPATSVNALIVTGRFFGLGFAAYVFASVILMGVTVGLIGNALKLRPRTDEELTGGHCHAGAEGTHAPSGGFRGRMKAVLKYAYIEMPRDIGRETLLGLVLAAAVSVVTPLGVLMRGYLVGAAAYLFSLVFGMLTYMCSTMSVPLVDAFVKQGLEIGPALVLLIVGPITSYATILVLRKQFGTRLLLIYLGSISGISVLLGLVFSIL